MAGRFFNPFPAFIDSTPNVYSGGGLYFYAAGSSTPQNTYADKALSSPNTNPVLLNSAGRPAVDIFLQDLLYKIILKDSNSNVVWTTDNFSARDSQLIAKTLTGSGSPNGSVAGTAGSASILPDFFWDYTNLILYVATTTGTSSTTVWTAVNASTSGAVVPPPQGYLTLTSGVPIIPSDVTAATSVFYTSYSGNLVPIYNGSSFVPTVFTELQLTLNAAHAASNIYDVFVFNNSGVPTVVTGPSWSAGTSGSVIAGSCARGTGAGGAALARINGMLTNAVQITGRNGSTTYTINANLATYVGSIFMDGTNGQISCYRSYGQSRKWGVWNAYNREPIYMRVGDGTTSWSGAQSFPTFGPANANTANSITTFCGLAEEQIFSEYVDWMDAGAVGRSGYVAVGVNSTSAAAGPVGNGVTASAGWFRGTIRGTAIVQPGLGINVLTALEAVITACTFNGTQTYMQLTSNYRG